VDSHATILIIYAYTLTSITSVMIIEDFSIPSAVILSILFLRVTYFRKHWFGIAVCIVGITIGFLNDFLYFAETSEASLPMIGDICALSGAFLYALENVLQEYLLKKDEDVFNFLGFVGLFGTIMTFAYALILGELNELSNI
jgi:solute carrier family 35 protein F1/2